MLNINTARVVHQLSWLTRGGQKKATTHTEFNPYAPPKAKLTESLEEILLREVQNIPPKDLENLIKSLTALKKQNHSLNLKSLKVTIMFALLIAPLILTILPASHGQDTDILEQMAKDLKLNKQQIKDLEDNKPLILKSWEFIRSTLSSTPNKRIDLINNLIEKLEKHKKLLE